MAARWDATCAWTSSTSSTSTNPACSNHTWSFLLLNESLLSPPPLHLRIPILTFCTEAGLLVRAVWESHFFFIFCTKAAELSGTSFWIIWVTLSHVTHRRHYGTNPVLSPSEIRRRDRPRPPHPAGGERGASVTFPCFHFGRPAVRPSSEI